MKLKFAFSLVILLSSTFLFAQTNPIEVAANDTLLNNINKSKATHDIQVGELHYIYWGNIILLPSNCDEFTKKYNLKLIVVNECCKEEPNNITDYNKSISSYIDKKYGEGTMNTLFENLLNKYLQEIGEADNRD